MPVFEGFGLTENYGVSIQGYSLCMYGLAMAAKNKISSRLGMK